MTIDEEIATFLLADSGITALTMDVWQDGEVPQGKSTFVAFMQIDGPRDITFDKAQMINARWQFSSYAPTRTGCRTLHNAVVNAVVFQRGLLCASLSPPSGTFVESDSIEDERGPMYDYDRNLYRCDADIILTYDP